VIQSRVAQYFGSFLIMSGLIIGAFAARDAILFYAFFEAMLIPMYLIIGIWGGKNRVYAAIKFFLYTLMGSLLLLVAIIYLHQLTDSFEIARFYGLELHPSIQKCLFMAFFLSFAVKVPMWPVHTWLPDAHVEAPTGGSMILAAITLKLGAYGFLRFAMPIAPDAVHYFAPMMQFFSLVAVVYIGAVALAQTDMKKLIAYSSIAHMGFVTLGLFVFNEQGLLSTIAVEGAVMQMVSHGFVSAAMFMCIGVLYDRMHTRNIADYGGVANKMPVFASFFMLFAMANAGLPATSGFVGEFSVIMGVLQANFWLAFAAALTLIFGAAYTLWMYKRVLFGEVANAQVEALLDVTWREKCVLTILAIAVLGMGIYPAFFSAKIHASTQLLMQQVTLNVIAP
jgi:NADH-quinone oxidoreductase subunit M